MSMSSKKLNSLIAIIFCCYWLFSFLKIFIPDVNLKNAIENNSYAFILTPRVYKMYTSPPKSTTKTIYTFYKNSEAKLQVQADSLLKNRLKNSFGTLEFAKFRKWHIQYIFHNELMLTNAIYRYYWNRDIIRANPDSLRAFFMKNIITSNAINNNKAFAYPIIKELKLGQENYEKVNIKMYRLPIRLVLDKENLNKAAHIIKDSLIFNETLHLK